MLNLFRIEAEHKRFSTSQWACYSTWMSETHKASMAEPIIKNSFNWKLHPGMIKLNEWDIALWSLCKPSEYEFCGALGRVRIDQYTYPVNGRKIPALWVQTFKLQIKSGFGKDSQLSWY